MSASARTEEAAVKGAHGAAAIAARVLTHDGQFKVDAWQLVGDETTVAGPGDLIPLARYLALSEDARAGFGVWLASDAEPGQLAGHAATLQRIAVDFPAFKDGRGYSIAALLRTRHGYRGDLRATGEILIDQLFYLKRVGFSSFALRADQKDAYALAALSTFSDAYQASYDRPLPLFKRRAAGVRGVAA